MKLRKVGNRSETGREPNVPVCSLQWSFCATGRRETISVYIMV